MSKSSKKKKITYLGQQKNNLEGELKQLEGEREQLWSDISNAKDKLKGLKVKEEIETFAFPLEVVEKRSCAEACARAVADGDEMLRKHDLCSCINKIISVRGVLRVSDIRTGIRLARALGNTVYELCQPSPKWFEFKDFWREALRGIWESAHAKPDVWHVLLIENVDIASPECWGAPLWNLFDGKTTKLPCSDKSNLPKNLRVVVSLAPEDLGMRTEFAKSLGVKIGVEGPTMKKEEFLESLENISKLNERLFFTTKG